VGKTYTANPVCTVPEMTLGRGREGGGKERESEKKKKW
jgi:hypothetical protein